MSPRSYLSILTIAGTLLGGAVAANAQSYPMPTAAPGASSSQQGAPNHTGAPRHRNRMRMALRNLGLSAAQRGQIQAAFQQFRASRSSATPMTRRQLRDHIEGVLTPAQRQQFEANIRHRSAQAAPPAAS